MTRGVDMLAKVEIYHDGEFWCARGVGEGIFTQGETLDKLVENLKEAVELYFEDVLESGEEVKIISASEFEVGSVVKTAGG